MSRLGNILNAMIGLGYKETEQTVSGTMTQYGASAPLSSFYYIQATRPSDVPANAVPEIRTTTKLAWIAPMSGGSLRLLSIGSGTITATIVWRYRVS